MTAPEVGQGGTWARFVALARRRRRMLLVITAIVCVLVLVIVVTVAKTNRVDGPVAAAFQERSGLPAGPAVTEIPPFCGVSQRTVDRFAPGELREQILGADTQTCTWDAGSSASTFGGTDTELEVEVDKADEQTERHRPSTADAVDEFSRKLADGAKDSTGTKVGEVFPLAGLGPDAVGWHQVETDGVIHPDGKITGIRGHGGATTVLFRGGNVVVEVKYGGSDFVVQESDKLIDDTKGKALSSRTTLAGALAVAEDIATSMGLTVEGEPRVREPKGGTVEEVPKPCSLLPAELAKRIAPGADPTPTDGYLLDDEDSEANTVCDWSYDLELEVASSSSYAKVSGAEAAARRYRHLYHSARERTPEEGEEEHDFRTLSRPGEQAFVSYVEDQHGGVEAELVFRHQDVLVRVRSHRMEGYTKNKAMNEVYRVAVAAQKGLRK